MFDFRDLFQWERFITPSIIKIFYWLAVGIALLFGLSGIVSGLALMSLSPLAGLFYIIASLIGMVISVIFARIISEFVLIMFRINEHLGAIRQRGQITQDSGLKRRWAKRSAPTRFTYNSSGGPTLRHSNHPPRPQQTRSAPSPVGRRSAPSLRIDGVKTARSQT